MSSYQHMPEDDNRVTFLIDFKSFKVTDLKTRSRFREKLKLRIYFDDKKFKTEKAVIGGGDVEWKYHHHFEWHLTSQHTSTFVLDFVRKELENRYLKIYAHSAEDKTNPIGSVTVDFYTLATGPVEHNLPLLDSDGKPVGRLSFALEMVQLSTVTVMFKEVHVKNLRSIEDEVQGVNPYLKYGYSKDWPLIVDGRLKAIYSDTQMRTMNPSWDERGLPWLKFRTSLNELVKESLVLHVTHRGKITNTTLGRCNLLFRTLVDGGKSFKEEDLISFKGPLNKKQPDCTIEGKLIFKHLPVFAQMKPITGARPALHNEKGIYDAMPLLSWTPRPKVPVMSTEAPSQNTETPKSPRKKNITRTRSNSDTDSRGAEEVKRQESFRDLRSEDSSKNLRDSKDIRDSNNSTSSNSSYNSTSSTKAPTPTGPQQVKGGEVPTADLISFTPPNARKRAVSHAPAPKMVAVFEDDPFNSTPSTNNLFGSKPENVLRVQAVSPGNPFGTSSPSFNPFAPQPFQQPQQPLVYSPPHVQQPATFNPFAPSNTSNDPFA